jgi:asparagine synthase (glutamine-hydrolysing)
MVDPTTRVAISYNGEVYNFQALRRELEGLGHHFTSRTDSEVVLRSFLAWGPDSFARLEGMFAFAVWDPREAALWLVRDRLGIKPLYVEAADGELRWGSEVKAILAGAPGRRQVDLAALAEYCWFGNALRERSCWASVRRVLPGHALRWQDGSISTMAYWQPESVSLTGHSGSAEELRDVLRSAVERHLVADVPVGVFLSGGVDSSAITMLASRAVGDPLRTYAVSFDFSESAEEMRLAALVAKAAGTLHRQLHVTADDLSNVVRRLAQAHDEPFADAADVPLYLLCRALEGEVKVVLQGDGGDELFGGYRRYALLRRLRLLGPASRVVRGPLRLMPGVLAQRGARMADALGASDDGERFARLLTVDSPRYPPTAMLGAAWRARVEAHDGFAAYRDCARRFTRGDAVDRMLLTDLTLLLPDTFLEKVDKSTMALGVEVRVPFLDAAVVDYALALPAAMRMPGGRAKGLLKDALAGVVPGEILNAPKRGFGVPFKAWVAGPLRPLLLEVANSLPSRVQGALDVNWVRERLDDHVAGRADHGFALWKALQLGLWLHQYDVSV